MLSSQGATSIEFSNANLFADEVRVGPLLSGLIRGNFSLDGYQLVQEIEVSFVSEFGYSLNFSVQGSSGDYWFEISASGFSSGTYEVYAVAEIGTGERYEYRIGSLTIIQDLSMLTTLILIGGAVIVIIVIVKRFISPSRKEGSP
jgi:hypothetical protein